MIIDAFVVITLFRVYVCYAWLRIVRFLLVKWGALFSGVSGRGLRIFIVRSEVRVRRRWSEFFVFGRLEIEVVFFRGSWLVGFSIIVFF